MRWNRSPHSRVEWSAENRYLTFPWDIHCASPPVTPTPPDSISIKIDVEFETEQEEDGRWVSTAPRLAGVIAYGATADEALARAEQLAEETLDFKLSMALVRDES